MIKCPYTQKVSCLSVACSFSNRSQLPLLSIATHVAANLDAERYTKRAQPQRRDVRVTVTCIRRLNDLWRVRRIRALAHIR